LKEQNEGMKQVKQIQNHSSILANIWTILKVQYITASKFLDSSINTHNKWFIVLK